MPGIHNGIGTTFRSSAFGGGTPPVNLDFVSTWDTTKAGSASDTVVLPLLSGGTYSGTIDWGDGSTSVLSYANRTHTYASSGVKVITISGQIDGWRFNNAGDKAKITDISNWGTLNITTNSAFFGCSNLDVSATDAPVISTTDLIGTFKSCTSLTEPDLNSWDVSSVTLFGNYQSGVFFGASNANPKIELWDVSSGTSFRDMFWFTQFNRDISNWNISSATGLALSGMFAFTPFNQPIQNWTLPPAVTSLGENNQGMFHQNSSFNQPIGVWNTSSIIKMRQVFQNATSFDQDLSNWQIAQVTDFYSVMIGVTLSTANYDALLIAWDSQGAMSYSGTVNFGGSKYTAGGAAEAARTSLISKWGGIIDGGAA
jgi:surface protein